MIPKIIHYCWFGRGEMPQLAIDCIASWHKFMPDWEYHLWNEDNFDVYSHPYTKEAYLSKKYAFVSDYVRLKALHDEGGLYLDVDFEVFKSFEDLLGRKAFAGFEGSKHKPVMMGVCASESNGIWIQEMLDAYTGKHFIVNNGMDLTPNVTFLTNIMKNGGLSNMGIEQDYKDLHIYPTDYFCPRQTSGEYLKTNNTYCEHLGLGSWSKSNPNWKNKVAHIVGPKNTTFLIKLKREIIG